MTDPSGETLAMLRQQLDDIDEVLLRHLAKRFSLIREVALYKRDANVPVMQPRRVAEVLHARRIRGAELGLGEVFVTSLWQALIDEACAIEEGVLNPSIVAARPTGCDRIGPAAIFSRAVIIGASGGIGSLFRKLLAPAVGSLVCFDILADAKTFKADVLAPSQELIAALDVADVVILALPDQLMGNALSLAVGTMNAGALIVETSSVKTPTVKAWGGRGDCELLLVNPLFGPDIPSAGRKIAVVTASPGPRSHALIRILGEAGLIPVLLTADEHDRNAAVSQALVHLMLLAYAHRSRMFEDSRLGVFSTPLDDVLRCLAARMLGGKPEMYWRIQNGNPWAGPVRAQFIEALRAICDILASADAVAFNELWRGASAELPVGAANRARYLLSKL